jgi:hypothetical protein
LGSKIAEPFDSDKANYVELQDGDIFGVYLDGEQKNRKLLTSDIKYVKRITKKQAQRLIKKITGADYESDESDDDDSGQSEDHNDSEDSDEYGDGEMKGRLSESDEEPSAEKFI